MARTFADLSSHNCLGYTPSSSLRSQRWVFGVDGKSTASVRGNLQASNEDALVTAALVSQGLISEPAFLIGDEGRSGFGWSGTTTIGDKQECTTNSAEPTCLSGRR